jgi:hypothetical protein
MSLNPLSFGPAPMPTASVSDKLDYCLRALVEIERQSKVSAMSVARDFSVDNLTVSRTFDADTVTTAQLADVVGTILLDLKDGGSKRT